MDDLYKKLETIFVEYTTHQWKNGWEHEGDRKSKELTIQKNEPWNNLFLLQKTTKFHGNAISLDGPNRFRIEIQNELNRIRIDIEYRQIGIDIFYYIDNELDWISNQDFIIDLCQNVYNFNVLLRDIPNNIYGDYNPEFIKPFRRERQLNELGI